MKTCRQCKQSKELDAFPLRRTSKDGRYAYCRRCSAERSKAWRERDPERARAVARRWYAAHPEKVRIANTRPRSAQKRADFIWRKYGLTLEELDARITAQGGRCALCQIVPQRLCVDYDHATGRVRALLCAECNAALGLARESPTVLRAMAAYLESHTAERQTQEHDA